ncbi:hypothetical protein LMH87_000223 [Akanthomyces muscarius]|uniref:Uncharacterized protein n=1 Tax=Akanthomyces muscarius TaxID=2231603 RepID=A0A9W8UKX4_AKAMU|nr:hypothetical protein LMH87_000223 [Akanthomyces muscarius]KAJ4154953.1 hypothetical protein LMH87_000223 [Akanthomyces muscarius]
MAIDFQTDSLDDDKEFYIPLIFVKSGGTRHHVVLARRGGIKFERPRPGRCLFRRPFDCTSDTMYVHDDKWDDFYLQPIERIDVPELMD